MTALPAIHAQRRPNSLPPWLSLLFAALAIHAAASFAQDSPGKIVVINSSRSVERYRLAEDEFRRQMDGQTIVDVNLEETNMDAEDLRDLVDRENPGLIYSIGSEAFQLAGEYGGDKLQLFSSVINWQRFPRHANVYGIANELSLSQELSLLRYLLPKATRVGVIFDPKFNRERVAEAHAYSQEVGLTLVEQAVENSTREEVEDAVDELLPQIDVLWLISDPGILIDRDRVEGIFQAADGAGKPVYAYSDVFIRFGASLVVAADIPTIGRQAATLAQSLLHHKKPGVAVQSPVGSRITLNVCHLGKLKVGYNEDALDSVSQLIECR
ncbi:ABC transporter substrate-binding protein [Candidatus Methylospira mobilis]|nr:ABC transporter substrate binding protein [Candidatus Methylospira mobilis]